MSHARSSFVKLLPIFIILGGLCLVLLALRPIPRASYANCSKHSGIVTRVVHGQGKSDIVITLQDDPNYYYINRGTARGLSVTHLNNELRGKTLDLFTVNHWTPLDPMSGSKHVALIRFADRVVYSEMTP